MGRKFFILLFAVVIAPTVSSAAGTLTAYLLHSSFNTSAGSSYIETYIRVMGRTTTFVGDSIHKFRGKVNIAISFTKGDTIVAANNYNLKSVEIKDSSNRPDFIDVQRYWMKKGVYTLNVALKDLNNPNGKTVSESLQVEVGYNKDSISISTPEVLQSYTASSTPSILNKNGYDMVPYVPYVEHYYPQDINQLKFYAEIYNAYKIAGLNEKFVVKYCIESAETHVALNEFNSVSVQKADTVNPILGGFNIQDLPSGNYFLKIEIADKNNNVRATRRYDFLRHNPNVELSMKSLKSVDIANTFVNKITNKDTLVEDIRCLTPIAKLPEKDFAMDKGLASVDITLLRQYFYNFWYVRNATDPEGEWKKYYMAVKAVNKSFGTYGVKGYQTDRGRVFLQYGMPAQKYTSTMNPATYPYEIWQYYKLPDGEVNKKFVFYSPDEVTNNYVLLHSDATGEIHNRQWQLVLYGRTGQPSDVDQNKQSDPYGENTLDEFSNPR